MRSRLAWNLHQSFCPSLPIAGIIVMHQHAWFNNYFQEKVLILSLILFFSVYFNVSKLNRLYSFNYLLTQCMCYFVCNQQNFRPCNLLATYLWTELSFTVPFPSFLNGVSQKWHSMLDISWDIFVMWWSCKCYFFYSVDLPRTQARVETSPFILWTSSYPLFSMCLPPQILW